MSAHRFSWEMVHGAIPEGMQIDHLCRTRSCVNPEHMEVVSPQVNTLRGQTPAARNAAKTHCPQGHAYTAENTYRGPDGRSRSCRICGRDRRRRFEAKYGRRKS